MYTFIYLLKLIRENIFSLLYFGINFKILEKEVYDDIITSTIQVLCGNKRIHSDLLSNLKHLY